MGNHVRVLLGATAGTVGVGILLHLGEAPSLKLGCLVAALAVVVIAGGLLLARRTFARVRGTR